MYWLLYILDMRFVLFLCTTAVWQFAINEYEWMNEWMKSVLNFVARLATRRYPHLPMSAGVSRDIDWQLVRNRYLLPAPALSSKPAAHHCCCRSTGQTDGETTPDRYIDLALYTTQAASVTIRKCTNDSPWIPLGLTSTTMPYSFMFRHGRCANYCNERCLYACLSAYARQCVSPLAYVRNCTSELRHICDAYCLCS